MVLGLIWDKIRNIDIKCYKVPKARNTFPSLGKVVHSLNSSSWETEAVAGRSLRAQGQPDRLISMVSSRPVRAT